MLFSTLALLLLPSPTIACWAPCPEGKECYFEEVWLSKTELQEMADAQCPAANGTALQASTGLKIEFTCSPDGNKAKQTAPNLAMKIKGENDTQNFRSDCSGQEDCLAADKENRKLFDRVKAEKTASN